MQYGLSNCLLDMQFIKLKMHVHKLKFLMMFFLITATLVLKQTGRDSKTATEESLEGTVKESYKTVLQAQQPRFRDQTSL